jgi:hypothetical protein
MGNPVLRTLGLSRLEEVRGAVMLGGLLQMQECSDIHGTCRPRPVLLGNRLLQSTQGLSSLRRAGGLYVLGLEGLGALSLPSLAEVRGDVWVGGAVLYVRQPRANRVGELLSLGNPSLEHIDLRALRHVGGEVRVERNDALLGLGRWDALAYTGGLEVLANASLRRLGTLDELVQVEGDLNIGHMPYQWREEGREVMWSNGNPALVQLEGLGALTRVGGAMRVVDNAALSPESGAWLHRRARVQGCVALCGLWTSSCRCSADQP